jgi:hypothetical protein
MSYCRFSTNDFQCDVYCYEGQDGFVVHVATRRPVYKEPLPPEVEFTPDDIYAWATAHVARSSIVSKMLDEAEHIQIGLPHDGKTFLYGTAGDAADCLSELKKLGYMVPDDAIEALREEYAIAD